MQLLILLILFFSFNPVFAGQEKTALQDYPSEVRFLNFDKESFLRKSQKRKIYSGNSIEYVIDYDPSDKEHHSITKSFFRDDDGHFYKLDSNAVVRPSKHKSILVNSTAEQATGNQRVLVIPVGDLTVSSQSFIFNPDVLRAAYFSTTENSLNTYYKEVSSNKVSFSGNFTNLFLVDRLCEGGDIFNNGGADFLLEQVDAQIDLSAYDRVSFVFPDDSFCLGRALGVGTLGKLSYVNPFGKQTNISVNFNVSAGAEIGNVTYFLKVLTHEFGHNFGLKHDNANACGKVIFERECLSLEYGGVHSIMGYSPNLAHVNAIHKYDLKWLTDSQVAILDEDTINSEFKLVPLAQNDNTGLKAIKIKRNDGSYYAVEYRKPVGMETAQYSTSTLSYGGIQIYLNNDDHLRDSVLIRKDFKVFDSQNSAEAFKIFDLASFTPGEVFYDSVSDIRITPVSIDDTGINILVEKAIENGGGTAADDPSFLNNNGAYRLNSTGITNTNLNITFNGDLLANARVKIIIPRAYKKLIKIKNLNLSLTSNSLTIPAKIASVQKLGNSISTNEDGLFEINIQMQLIDKVSKRVLVDSIVPLLFEPQLQN
jgi:hypothetical protein